jgi:hypothetical protein
MASTSMAMASTSMAMAGTSMAMAGTSKAMANKTYTVKVTGGQLYLHTGDTMSLAKWIFFRLSLQYSLLHTTVSASHLFVYK